MHQIMVSIVALIPFHLGVRKSLSPSLSFSFSPSPFPFSISSLFSFLSLETARHQQQQQHHQPSLPPHASWHPLPCRPCRPSSPCLDCHSGLALSRQCSSDRLATIDRPQLMVSSLAQPPLLVSYKRVAPSPSTTTPTPHHQPLHLSCPTAPPPGPPLLAAIPA